MVTKEQAIKAFNDYMGWAIDNWKGKDASPYDDRKADGDAATVMEFIEQPQTETKTEGRK